MSKATLFVTFFLLDAVTSKLPALAAEPQRYAAADRPKLVTITPFENERGAYYFDKDFSLRDQIFVYDTQSRVAAIPAGPDMSAVGSPVPMRIVSMNFASFHGGACAIYKNILFFLKKS